MGFQPRRPAGVSEIARMRHFFFCILPFYFCLHCLLSSNSSTILSCSALPARCNAAPTTLSDRATHGLGSTLFWVKRSQGYWGHSTSPRQGGGAYKACSQGPQGCCGLDCSTSMASADRRNHTAPPNAPYPSIHCICVQLRGREDQGSPVGQMHQRMRAGQAAPGAPQTEHPHCAGGLA